MTLIVVEGIDGSGKSSLIADLAHHLPDSVHIIRRGPLTRHPMEEYEYDLTEYSPTIGRTHHYLLDRWHVGELIYGPLYRGSSQVTRGMRLHIELVLEKLGALKILMDTPLDEVKRRLAKRGEDFLQPQHHQIVWDAYREWCTGLDGWALVNPKYDVGTIVKTAEKLEDDAYHLDEFQTYIGGLYPKLLLLGDHRHHPVLGRPRYPWAFVPYRDTSGHYLFSALDMVGMRDFGVANASEEDVPRLWETLGEPKIVVLGTGAWDHMRRTYAKHEMFDSVARRVTHPQHARRFHYDQMRSYGEFIKGALDG